MWLKLNVKKWHLLFKIIPMLVLVCIFKYGIHIYNLEFVSLNTLFSSIIASTTFLIWFLITWVISDYKESEKIPWDLASIIETIYDELYILDKNKGSDITKSFLTFHKSFIVLILDWFHRKVSTRALLDHLHQINDRFASLESLMQANFLSRMKNEQSNLRKLIIRIDNIRDLSFIQSAYAIVETLAFFLILSLIFMKIEIFYESIIFVLLVSFLVIYMIMLIKDLDNPFDYKSNWENWTEVSLKPIRDVLERVNSYN